MRSIFPCAYNISYALAHAICYVYVYVCILIFNFGNLYEIFLDIYYLFKEYNISHTISRIQFLLLKHKRYGVLGTYETYVFNREIRKPRIKRISTTR